MRAEDIKPGRTYRGGKNDDQRAVVRYGAHEGFVCWAPERERLPYGGFVNTRCTATATFAKWATEEVPK